MYHKIFFLVCFISIFLVSSAFATIWRVDNTANPGADFDNVQAAHDAAANGDTIYIYGSPHDYSGFTLSKTLYIYGPGYFLADNPETQAYTYPAKIRSQIVFNAGSEHSLMIGLDIYLYDSPDDRIVYVNADSVIIKRNYIRGAGHYYGNEDVLRTGSNRKGIIITGNYMVSHYEDEHHSHWPHNIKIGANNSYISISNNYLDMYTQLPEREAIYSPSSSENIIITNNVIRRSINVCNAVIQNNILRDGTFTGIANLYTHNIGDAGQFGTENGNFTAGMDTVFVNTGSPDGKWRLAEGSPAIGTGTPEGTDIGMFGGFTPYVLSGMPDLPAVYFFNAPAVINEETGLPINVKIKSHD